MASRATQCSAHHTRQQGRFGSLSNTLAKKHSYDIDASEVSVTKLDPRDARLPR